MTVKDGEIFCLLGHNGAGKSTIVNILTGLIPPTSGNILYYGEDFHENIANAKRTVGFCPQRDILENKNTVRENLELITRIKEIPKDIAEKEIEDIMRQCNIKNYEKQLTGNLSGGNKRKLCIARALIGGSKIIILDEPTSGMDPASRRIIWNIIKGLKSSGRTVILTTQFLDEAEVLSDRVSVLVKGNIFCLGSVDYVKKNFGVGYHLKLLPKDFDSRFEGEKIAETVLDVIKSGQQVK